MNYMDIKTNDFSNGEGCRVTLFVSGCNHGCPGCYNKKTWNPKEGFLLTAEVEDYILASLSSHHGLSLSGGDPMYPRNREKVLDIVQRAKQTYPDKDIWMWTGYSYDEIKDHEIMKYIDVLIDGKYQQQNPTTKPWRGSDNQNLIKVKEIHHG